MGIDRVLSFLNDFPELKGEVNRLIAEGYRPFNISVDASVNEEGVVSTLKVQLDRYSGRRVCISQVKDDTSNVFQPVNTEVYLQKTDKDWLKLKLSQKQILNEELKKSFRGYRADEVDSFLDTIAEDYELIHKLLDNNQKSFPVKADKGSVKLNAEMVGKKKFPRTVRGYDCKEVDDLIKAVEEDYRRFEQVVSL
ncbi:MAG: DivIVA domain-containing protein [Bacillota bacterium]|nr:DivIVA domain-containing protein [Bacillota bacterium]